LKTRRRRAIEAANETIDTYVGEVRFYATGIDSFGMLAHYAGE
jgi:hypothetical protein